MAKTNDKGVYQLPNGNWEYRLVLSGKIKVDTTCRLGGDGLPFKTKRAAIEAREKKRIEYKTPKPAVVEKPKDATLAEVYARYLKEGTADKAKTTLRKQESMWENHIQKNFGEKLLSEITLADLTNYLSKLYHYGDDIEGYVGGYAYKYVEGFLKFFYLLFGTAFRYDLIDVGRYTKMFIDKGTRLTMPKIKQEDADDMENVKAYTEKEIAQIEEVFKRGNCYTAFLIGFYLGVRISECFGLRFSDFNWQNHTMRIRCQMGYEDGCFHIGPVKTLTSVREIYIPDVLFAHLEEKELEQERTRNSNPDAWRATEVVLDRTIDGVVGRIVGGDFINRKKNGELLTTNSIKSWAKAIKKETGINFEYHSLRKTHATMMANLNTPAIELMHRLGHKKYETTLKLYINENQLAKEIERTNINDISLKVAEARADLEQVFKFRRDIEAAIGKE